MALRIHSSNRQETLAQILQQQLFADSSTAFDRRIIASPSAIHHQWLQVQFASDLEVGIAMGVEFLSEDQCMTLIAGLFSQQHDTPTVKYHPTRLELSFAIEQQLAIQAATQSLSDTKKQRRRRIQLADTYANLFALYGQFGEEGLKHWPEGEEAAFQQRLWQHLYADQGGWGYPYRWLDDLDFTRCVAPRGLQVHLFCPSFLCKLHQTLVEKLAEHMPVTLYLLSPCQMFWSDQLAGRERRRLNAYWQRRGASSTEQQRLGELLSDTNPLLAQWGRLGREMAAQLENTESLNSELYQIPAAAARHPDYGALVTDDVQSLEGAESLTLLHAIQSDFLVLRNPHDSDPICLGDSEDSVQCHATPSPLREVQVVYQQLLHLLDRHSDDAQPITAGDIRIFVSDLRRYAPLIEATFGATGRQLAIQLLDLPLVDHSLFIQSFLALLHLAQGRWEAPALLEFLRSPYVQRRHQILSTDVDRLREWIQQLPIYWGEDGMHRNALLRDAHCRADLINGGAAGTWQQGLHALLLQLTQVEAESIKVEFSDATLIGTWITLLQSLADDLRPLHDGTKMELGEWGRYLECLCNAYLTPTDRISQSHRELLFAHFETLQRTGRWLPDTSWGFNSILKRLEGLLERHGVTMNEGDLDTIRVCALRPHRAVPARVVVLLGMEEGAFPRSSSRSPFDLLKGNLAVDYCPTETERDRYLFLECLLSARDYFLMSYSQTSPEDGKEQGACLPVEELLAYIKAHYRSGTLPKVVTVSHPFYAFDPSYFKQHSPLHNYSKDDYRAAQAYLQRGMPESRELSAPTPFTVRIAPSETDAIIDLRHLETAVRDPVKLFLNQTLGIYLRADNPREVKATEPFVLSQRQRYALRGDALREPLEQVMARAAKRGQMPFGVFGSTASEQLRQDLQPTLALQAGARGLQLLPRIQFSAQCHEPRVANADLWQFPAIQVGSYKIIGTLDRLTVQGLLADGDGAFPDAVKSWPAFLALQILRPHLQRLWPTVPDNAILFLEKGRTKNSFVDDPMPHLELLIEYYSRCLKTPSLLHADWVRQFLSGAEHSLAALIEKDLRDITTRFRHLQWLWGAPSRTDLQPLITPWISDAKALYRPLATNWYRLTEEVDATL